MPPDKDPVGENADERAELSRTAGNAG
jgi:hypothetical protein